jgi:hypothetical protein
MLRSSSGAEETLLSDRNNNELLIINLATVPAERILIPVLHKCVAVGRNFYEHSNILTLLQLKPVQITISIILIVLCAILFLTYGRTSFATLSERSGFYGSLYQYYNVSRVPFGVYNLLIALLSSAVIILQIKSLIKNDKTIFKNACWLFFAVAILLILVEIYLQMRFHGKG